MCNIIRHAGKVVRNFPEKAFIYLFYCYYNYIYCLLQANHDYLLSHHQCAWEYLLKVRINLVNFHALFWTIKREEKW